MIRTAAKLALGLVVVTAGIVVFHGTRAIGWLEEGADQSKPKPKAKQAEHWGPN